MPVTYQSALSVCQMVRLPPASPVGYSEPVRADGEQAQAWPQGGSSGTRSLQGLPVVKLYERHEGWPLQGSSGSPCVPVVRAQRRGVRKPRVGCELELEGSEWEGGFVEADGH